MLPPPGSPSPLGVPLLTWSMSWSRVSRVPTPDRSGPRRPPVGGPSAPCRAWQLRHCLFWKTAAPCSSSGVWPRTMLSGTGVPLQPVITGDQGDSAPWYVSTPRKV